MALHIESTPFYYDQEQAGQLSYRDYQQKVAMTRDITDSIESSANRSIAANALFAGQIQSTLIDNQIASANAGYNNTRDMIGAFYDGFSDVSRQIGEMSANMSMGFAALNTSVRESAQAIYDRLDTMNDILNNPSLTKSRELFRRASVNYNKGFYEEAGNDLRDALASDKTDYISWFLLGKTYLFGAGEFGNVIDLDAAVDALKNAVKFITPDARKEKEARLMAGEMCFFLGLARQTRAMDALHAHNEAECRNYLEQAAESYSQSWDYSAQMREAVYNRARCRALLGDAQGAIADLETAVLLDRNYCIKVCADNDFASIAEEFAALIKKMKKAVFIPAKKDYDYIETLLSELASLSGKTRETVPSTFTEELPYFDILDYAKEFKRVILRIAKYKVCVSAGYSHIVGLKADGTVVAAGKNEDGQCDVSDWREIVAVSAGNYHTVGLKADGTVVAIGCNSDWQCHISSWRDIVAVSAGNNHTVGLKADGTVVATGNNVSGECNVGGWRNIVAVAAGDAHTVGLKADGTVVATGKKESGRCNVNNWREIVAIAAGDSHTVGLKEDGTVVATGGNKDGQCNVGGWREIAAVAAGGSHTVGLKEDGTVVAVGGNKDGQCNVGGWRGIVAVVAGYNHTVGLKEDDTVVAAGGNKNGQCNVSGWRGIGPVSKEQAKEWAERLEREAKEKAEREAKEEAEQEARATKKKAEREAKEKAEREAKEKAGREAKEAEQQQWQAQGLCSYCGGKLGGLFIRKCKVCGKEKSY